MIADDLSYPIGMHPVSDGVYYIARANASVRPREYPIRFVEADTGRKRTVATVTGNLGWGLSLAPDRRSLVFCRIIPGTFDIAVVRPAR